MAGQVPPITATCVIVGADAYVEVSPANHPLILQTPFLGWMPAPAGATGVPQVRLLSWQMLKAFGARLSASRSPADLPASRNANPLLLALTGGLWTRYLNELVASGLLALAGAQDREALIEGVGKLAISTTPD